MLAKDIVDNLKRAGKHGQIWYYLVLNEIIKTGDINSCLKIPKDNIGPILNDIDQCGKNLLMLAIQDDIPLEFIKYFLDIGMDPNVQCLHFLETALMIAVECYNKKVFDLLLEYRANPNLQDFQGQTVLFDAVTEGYTDFTLKLLQQKANPNIQDNNGNTPLICVIIELNNYYKYPNIAIRDQIFMMDRLYNRKSSGFKALGYEEIIDLLLEYGADPYISNNEGLSALDYAIKFGFKKIEEKLRKFKINTPETVETAKIDMQKQADHSNNIKVTITQNLINYNYFKVLVFDSKIHLVFFDDKDQIIIEFCDTDSSKIIEDSKKHIASIDHAIYLGQELTKAEICLKNGIEYNSEQPSSLILSRY